MISQFAYCLRLKPAAHDGHVQVSKAVSLLAKGLNIIGSCL